MYTQEKSRQTAEDPCHLVGLRTVAPGPPVAVFGTGQPPGDCALCALCKQGLASEEGCGLQNR